MVCCNFICLLFFIKTVFLLAGYPAFRPDEYPAGYRISKKPGYPVQPYFLGTYLSRIFLGRAEVIRRDAGGFETEHLILHQGNQGGYHNAHLVLKYL